MGCGGSKLDPNQQEVPARFKPILRCRLEEIRARTTGSTTNGLSKKELLLGEVAASHDSDHDKNSSNTPDDPNTFHDTQECPPIPQKISGDSSSKILKGVGNDIDVVCESSSPVSAGERLLGQCGACKTNKRPISPNRPSSLDGAKDDESDSEDYIEQGCLSHGSPSFRVYCTEFPDDEDLLEELVEGDIAMEAQRHSISMESSSSNEVSVKPMPTKKGKRGRKFKMMMPKGGKIFNNMHSFYTFPCSSHNNTHLLQKAAA